MIGYYPGGLASHLAASATLLYLLDHHRIHQQSRDPVLEADRAVLRTCLEEELTGRNARVSSDSSPEMTIEMSAPIREGTLTINIRAEDDPNRIGKTVEEVLAQFESVQTTTMEAKQFRPGRPNPIHRTTQLTS